MCDDAKRYGNSASRKIVSEDEANECGKRGKYKDKNHSNCCRERRKKRENRKKTKGFCRCSRYPPVKSKISISIIEFDDSVRKKGLFTIH